ncbi:hypothetical protein, partial [Zoogloea sp.]|uniref:hypothetical protein n=1 Tax=Zoogloea sp. TaxID=49181 RepID=UPI002D1FAD15
MNEIFHQLVAGKQVLHLAQVNVEVVVLLEIVGFGHGAGPVGGGAPGGAQAADSTAFAAPPRRPFSPPGRPKVKNAP